MALKFITSVKTNDEYKSMVLEASATTLCVVDAYASWCGPCDALGKKIGNLYQDMMDYDIKWVQAQVDDIELLEEQIEKSKPLFLFIKGGEEVARMPGASAVELQSQVEKLSIKKPSQD
uniref:Thioredoxin domain-containing protein n=1 Tax=Prymnesium polylepis TaxID=72548 RepID=A0A7S4I1X1_9EUKA